MRNREKGAALVWALVLLLLAASLSTLLLARGQAVDAATKTDVAGLKALYAAEGGVALARQRLAKDPAWKGETVRVGECEVTVRVERQDGRWHVQARADGTSVEATLRAAPGLPANVAYSAAGR